MNAAHRQHDFGGPFLSKPKHIHTRVGSCSYVLVCCPGQVLDWLLQDYVQTHAKTILRHTRLSASSRRKIEHPLDSMLMLLLSLLAHVARSAHVHLHMQNKSFDVQRSASAPLMATFSDLQAFKDAIHDSEFLNRHDFLQTVKYSTITNTAPFRDTTSLQALIVAQELAIVPNHHCCDSCGCNFSLLMIENRFVWRGPRYDDSCMQCQNAKITAGGIGFFKGTHPKLWLDKLDCFMMWTKEYQRDIIILELNIRKQHVDEWLAQFQQTISVWTDFQLQQGFQSNMFQTLQQHSSKKAPSRMKRPASCKRPASGLRKKPVSNTPVAKKSPRVFIADESYLNKRKAGSLSRTGRPQKDQVWIWGAVLEGCVSTHFIFRILKHPSEAAAGKPRGHAEMLDNLGMLGLSKGDIFVSDSWPATTSAVKAFRRQHELTERTLPHEKVNHSAGEIKNSNGYSTNAIEAKWSLLKRWARRKLGGKLPSHSDRVKWHRLINEYQGRCILKRRHVETVLRSQSGPKDFVSFKAMIKLFEIA